MIRAIQVGKAYMYQGKMVVVTEVLKPTFGRPQWVKYRDAEGTCSSERANLFRECAFKA